MANPRLRYDAPDERGARYEAAWAVVEAVARLKPEVILQLRDLELHQAEGWDVVPLRACELFNERARPDEVGRLQVLTTLPAPVPAADEIYVAGDRDMAEPVIAVFIPPAVFDWARRWNLSTPEFEVTAVLMRQMWRRHPAAAAEGKVVLSSLPSVMGDGGAKLLSEGFWQSAGLQAPPVDPMFGSETDVLRKTKDIYQARARLLESGEGLSRKRVRRRDVRELEEHADWLARRQVLRMSPTQTAEAVSQEVGAIDRGARRLAAFLNLQLRPLPRRGRPAGRRDVSAGRRPSKKS